MQVISLSIDRTALRISGGRSRELVRGDDRPLQPLDGRRAATGIRRMGIRSADGAALSASILHFTISYTQPNYQVSPINARREAVRAIAW